MGVFNRQNKRDCSINLKLSSFEITALKEMAHYQKMNQSEYIRTLLLTEYKRWSGEQALRIKG